MDFVHLHVHSHYSLLNGLPKIDELVIAAKQRGFKALALTDYGAMYGTIEFYKECLAAGIKPIIGLEAYYSPNYVKGAATAELPVYHLVLLAENLAGYKNLMQLSSLGFLQGLNNKPTINEKMLIEHHEGIIALSGCLEGEVPAILGQEKNYNKAKQAALKYEQIFGKNNFYLELLDLPAKSGQLEVNIELIKLSKDTEIPLVVTRDAHYLNPEDAEAQDILVCIGEGRTIDEPNRPTKVGIDYSLATGKDIASRFKHVAEAVDNTAKIADRINLELKLNKWNFPQIDIPTGKNADNYLRELVYERLPALAEITPAVKDRLEYELNIIITKGYSPYFLVVADYVNYARAHGIIETTRGSAAGSLVSYALGITNVNPLYFKLPFERFLTTYRPSPPDVDADFADDRRDEMIDYVTQKYGDDKVAQIITFGTMQARGAVRDVGRALGYSYSFCDQVAKLIPFGAQGFQMTIAKAIELEPELKTLYNKNDQVRRLLDLAQKIEGCARHTSVHAAGVVIAPTPLTNFTPVQTETGGEKIITQYEMSAVEAAGLLKMDFLGIRNLSILGHAVEIVEKTTGQKIDLHKLAPWDDKKTYEMLARGETVGVFQLSGSGMTRYLKDLKPSTIFDIMAMVALFRPGPMESIPEYIKRKRDPSIIDFLDPRMKDYLDQSLGLIVYQDDVLLTAINLAGYSWEEADKFRKAMGKKIPAEMAKQKEKFFKGCKNFGKLPELKIHRLWELIEPFAAYGFNKAHAASYGVVAYQTAYLKANYPLQYMTAVLIAESGDIDKVPAIIHECERMGIKVLPPNVNESFKSFAMIAGDPSSQPSPAGGRSSEPSLQGRGQGEETPMAGHIRFGLNGIKNLGEHIAEVIYRERKENGQYKNLDDFLLRVKDKDLNKKSLESLIKCGAMDCFGYDRGILLANIENILNFIKENSEASTVKQHSLFSGSKLDVAGKLRLAPAPNATSDEMLHWEKELLGLYVTAHPFSPFIKILAKSLTYIADLPSQTRNTWVVVGGVIDKTKKKITRSGKPMMFVTIQDTSGSQELLVFPRTYETTKDVWVEGKVVCVMGKTSEEEGDDKLFVEKAYELTKENASTLAQQLFSVKQASSIRNYVEKPTVGNKVNFTAEGVEIKLTPLEMKNKADDIKLVLKKYPGDKQLFLLVANKKIKTQYKVGESDGLAGEIEKLLRSN